MLIIGGSRSEKTNVFLNLIKQQDTDSLIDKIYLYAKDFSEPKYKFLIKKHEDVGIKHLNDPSAFIDYIHTLWMMFATILMIISK